jgi:hypothetical protein
MKAIILWLVLHKQLLTFWARGKIFDFIERKNRHHEGYCMCGDKIEYHSFGSGHSPVDAWYYYRDQFVYRTKR